nr:PEGA domain-containing protein [Deltaproteobacteria bacterium]
MGCSSTSRLCAQGSLDVTVAARNTRPFAITLVQGGNVYVAADVDGAPIFLDGTQMGVTPGRLNNVPPGAHIIELRMEGREPVRETVNVTSGTLSTVNVTLRPRVAPTGSVRVIVSTPNGPVPAAL